MTTKNKRWRLLAVLAVLAIIVAACGDTTEETTTTAEQGGTNATTATTAPMVSTTAAAPTGGGTVHGSITEPPAIDPQLVSDSEAFEVMRLVFDGLTLYDPAGGAVIPGVAESWEPNDDNTVWTFHLRDGVTFSDGSPVTAQSFVDGVNRLADPDLASPVAYHGSLAGIVGYDEVNGSDPTDAVGDQPVEGVVAVDDLTLEIHTNAPNVFIPKIVAHPAFSPVNMELTQSDTWGEQPVGNGPYVMTEPWQHDVSITLARNDSYYGEAGLPDTIEFLMYADQTAQFNALLDGTIDVNTVPAESEEQARAQYDNFTEVPSGSFGYLGFPTQVAPYDNPEMRKALTMAVDREAIVTQIMKSQVANGFVPPVAYGAVDGTDTCAACAYDADAAKELFDSLGGIPGNSVSIVFNAGAGHEDWIEAVANDWTNNLGLDVEFESQEWAAYLDFLFATEDSPTQPFRLGWLWDYPSAYNFLAPLYQTGSSDNYSHYSNTDFDALMDQAAQAPTEDDAIPFLEQAQEILGEEVPVMPMNYGVAKFVYNDTVSNVQYNNFGFFLWEDMQVNG